MFSFHAAPKESSRLLVLPCCSLTGILLSVLGVFGFPGCFVLLLYFYVFILHHYVEYVNTFKKIFYIFLKKYYCII